MLRTFFHVAGSNYQQMPVGMPPVGMVPPGGWQWNVGGWNPNGPPGDWSVPPPGMPDAKVMGACMSIQK